MLSALTSARGSMLTCPHIPFIPQSYVHLRSGRIEPAFAIASGLHKEIEEEETVRYHAKFYSFLSYQALAEVSLGLYEELTKNNVRVRPLSSLVSVLCFASPRASLFSRENVQSVHTGPAQGQGD
jgi:hypothetical protein